MVQKDSKARSFAKAVSWRFFGAIDTALIAWILTGNPLSGAQMGIADVLSKIVFFYIHERIWEQAYQKSEGRLFKRSQQKSKNRKIHLIKAITWRVFSSTLTVILAWVILKDPWMGLKIGVVEVFTKIGLYYLHERIWYRSDFGIQQKD